MTLYNCKQEINRDGETLYRITKFTSDLDVESSYLTTREACECPAGQRPTCRHRQMLPRFITRKATNGQEFLNYDKIDILGDDAWLRTACEPEQDVPDVIAEAVGEPTIPVRRPGFLRRI